MLRLILNGRVTTPHLPGSEDRRTPLSPGVLSTAFFTHRQAVWRSGVVLAMESTALTPLQQAIVNAPLF